MKFVWSAPPKHSDKSTYPKIHWDQPILGWLRFNGVWPEPNTYENKYFEMSYNYCYGFFDITIYEHEANCGKGEPNRVIEAMRAYLSSTLLKWREFDDYRWSEAKDEKGERKRILGVRFWIEAEKPVT